MSHTVIRRSLLDAPKGVLCHQVNCRGRMGKGLALAIKEKWPRVFDAYMRKFRSPGWRLGDAQVVQVAADLWVANLAGQDTYGRDPILYTDYAALGRALQVADRFAVEHNLPLFVPDGIGCGLAGGDWKHVLGLLPPGTTICQR